MRRKRAAAALGFGLVWGVILSVAHYLVEGGSLLRTSIIFITAGLFMTPVFYTGRPDLRVKKFVAWGASMLQRSPRTRPPGLSATPVQQESIAADATGPDDARPEHTG